MCDKRFEKLDQQLDQQ